MKNIYFTAGPAELYPRFEEFLKQAVEEQIGSISHRSGQFRKIYQHCVENLRVLMNIPETSGIFFTGSASEVWERILLNMVEHESFHLVNGSFSEKFYKYAGSLNKFAHKQEKPIGEGFSYAEVEVPEYAELICTTQNETSTGVQMREADIHKLKRSHQKKFIAVDMVSSAPIPELDLSLIDTAFFSVQKAFGLPAGLGVWIANEKCLEKSKKLAKLEGLHTGAHHTLPALWKNYETFETPATPNVLGIYLLGKVAEDMNRIGIDTIRKETDEKARKIYKYLETSSLCSIAVQNPEHRSRTVIVANTTKPSKLIIDTLKEKNMIIGSGYGPNKDTQIRISNFPSNTPEQVDNLLKELKNLE
ncbi:aminotransferase class V-fold PLP-dependent enzyme [Emticicia sp. TH156]|uniref:aminotransferase class V-fold PLP-dependent enzyme n=1 Tax=Emticicia sp. TH156 TaxID=2067454 RepID=UPI000C76E338|nr:aminotransferase class V-fold PLP-dependent enzyme [Emticicia sp. TH156]PLK45891.1 phosphoserine aminotransferase [Emticicia sp. TH156]